MRRHISCLNCGNRTNIDDDSPAVRDKLRWCFPCYKMFRPMTSRQNNFLESLLDCMVIAKEPISVSQASDWIEKAQSDPEGTKRLITDSGLAKLSRHTGAR